MRDLHFEICATRLKLISVTSATRLRYSSLTQRRIRASSRLNLRVHGQASFYLESNSIGRDRNLPSNAVFCRLLATGYNRLISPCRPHPGDPYG